MSSNIQGEQDGGLGESLLQDNIQNSQADRQEEQPPPDESNKAIEDSLQKAGGFNRYQKFILFFFVLVMMEISIVNLSQSFIYLPPTFVCNQNDDKQHSKIHQIDSNNVKQSSIYEGDNLSLRDTQADNNSRSNSNNFKFQLSSNVHYCGEKEGGCESQILEPGQKNTYSIQLDMYCDESHLRDLASSLLFVGSVIGSILLGIAGDIYGRKFVLITSWFIASLSVIGIAFTHNIPVLIIMNFIFGFFSQPVQNLLLLIVNEETSGTHRQMASQMLMIAWALGEIMLLILAYLMQNYREMVVYWMMIPSLILNIPLLFVIESPSYYLSKNKLDKTQKSLMKIAKFNKKELIVSDQLFEVSLSKESKDESILFNLIALFKFKSLRRITISASLVMICTYVFYFGCEFALQGTGYNLYINEAVASAGELIPLLIGIFIIPKLKRKNTSIIANLICILICLSYQIVKDSATQTTFIGLLRISNGFQFGIFQVYIPELFPTKVRSVGTGIIFGLGNLGSVIAPYVVSQACNIGIPDMVFIGIIGVTGFIATFFLKETLNKPLQNQIEELIKVEDSTQIFSPQLKKH